jgi:hypothetical protein
VFGADLEPVHASADLLVVGVNTTRAWRHKNGEVSAAQIDRVAGLLAAASPQQLRVVVVHQPAAVTRASDRANLLRGHQAALHAWSVAGADLVLGGHIHLPYTLAPQGLARRLWVIQAGTAVSSRTRAEVPNSVNILRWGEAPGVRDHPAQCGSAAGRHCLVEQWDFVRHDRSFVRRTVTPVQPERNLSRAPLRAPACGHRRKTHDFLEAALELASRRAPPTLGDNRSESHARPGVPP